MRPALRMRSELAALLLEPLRQIACRRQQIAHGEEDGHPRRRRVDVVGRLSHVHVVVGVDAGVRATALTEDLGRAVGEDLVGVHVVRRAGAGLVDVDDELIAELPAENLVGGFYDRACDAWGEPAERSVRLRRGLLDQDGGRNERRRGGEPADGEVLDRARRLSAVVRLRGHPDVAERVAFDAEGGPHNESIAAQGSGLRAQARPFTPTHEGSCLSLEP